MIDMALFHHLGADLIGKKWNYKIMHSIKFSSLRILRPIFSERGKKVFFSSVLFPGTDYCPLKPSNVSVECLTKNSL